MADRKRKRVAQLLAMTFTGRLFVMDESQSLGQFEKVDLRSVWSDEARDFTPWLAEENLDLLAETIGIDLELEGTEKSVGRFNADILCKDTVDDNWVLIENQLGRTDHKHLGQLLTYASGLGAVTIVWISDRFSDEHRSALDWLNEITKDGVNFFGLEVELWKIGDSPPAPKFNVESQPNDWSDQVSTAAHQQGLSDVKQTQLEYWTQFKEYLEERNTTVSPRKPRPQGWMNVAVGRSNCHLSAQANTHDNTLRASLYLQDREEAEPLFHLLKNQSEEIEAEIGYDLEWLLKPDTKRSIIQHKWEGYDPLDESDWLEQFEILSEGLSSFYQTFYPRLQRLNSDNWDPNEDI